MTKSRYISVSHRFLSIAVIVAWLCGFSAHADEARPVATDPVLGQHVYDLASQLRCVVCQNQSLAESNAALATDLRNKIRQQLKQGSSDEQVRAYLVARYGNFVLYNPPLQANTLLLWSGPFLMVVVGLVIWWRVQRKQKAMNNVSGNSN